MILVLKGADFSANNIGTIQVPHELSEFTKSVIDLYGANSDLTDNQKYALDDALNSIVSNGVYSKISSLYLPIIGTDNTKAILEIKTNGLKAASFSELGFTKHIGIGQLNKHTEQNPLTPQEINFTENLNSLNMSVMVWNTNPNQGWEDSQDGGIGLALASNNIFYPCHNNGGSFDFRLGDGSGGWQRLGLNTDYQKVPHFIAFSCDGEKLYAQLNDSLQNEDINSTAYEDVNVTGFTWGQFMGKTQRSRIGLMAFGTHLTDAERLAFYQAFKPFVDLMLGV